MLPAENCNYKKINDLSNFNRNKLDGWKHQGNSDSITQMVLSSVHYCWAVEHGKMLTVRGK